MLQEGISLFNSLPLFRRWDLALLWGAYVLCLIVPLASAGIARLCGRTKAPSIPYPDCTFPNKWDIAFAFLFLAFALSSSSTISILSGMEMKAITPADVVNNAFIYIPMLLRIWWLPISEQRANWSRTLAGAFITIFLALAFNIIYTQCGLMELIVQASGCPLFQETAQMLKDGTPSTQILLAIAAVVVAPICEECCFRGFLYNAIKKYSGPVVAALLSSLLFAAVHTSLAQTLPLMVFAMLLCLVYERTHSLRTCILAHAIFNAISVICIIAFGLDI